MCYLDHFTDQTLPTRHGDLQRHLSRVGLQQRVTRVQAICRPSLCSDHYELFWADWLTIVYCPRRPQIRKG